MHNNSRTAKSILNIKVAFLFYILNLALQFISRKIFLDYLGSEVLGLNTTSQNLLGFLNLAELGIGSAIAYSLYKPLSTNNTQDINNIVSVQGWMYHQIAWFIIIASCVLMLFFPYIFAKTSLPIWYAYGSFSALLIGSLLSYFFNYRQIVLSADQKEYKITYTTQSIKLSKIICQILAIRFVKDGYIYWLIFEVIGAIISSIALNNIIKKEYPWLTPKIKNGKILKKQYTTIITKTKQIFFHKISNFVLTQTSPLIIYGYASLSLVAIYGNYLLIITGISMLISALSNSLGAGVGNLVAKNDKKKIKTVFWEITSLRMWIGTIVCFSFYHLADSFITIWVGEQYILSHTTLIILSVTTFIDLTRTNDIFLSAYGLFKDVWAPIAEAILNLLFSIILGYYYGLAGILAGALISILIIVCCWKPYFLFRDGFKEPIKEYIILYTKKLLILTIPSIIIYIVLHNIPLPTDNFFHWTLYGSICFLIYGIVCWFIFYLFDQDFRTGFKRLYSHILK